MQISRLGTEGLKHTYRVVIEAEDINAAMDKELRALGGRVRIPGFRPGNVPVSVLKQRYGRAVRDDVLKNVITDATSKVLKDSGIRPASQPEVKVEQYLEGAELSFSLAVESVPEIPEIDYADISLEREIFEAPESEVDEALARLAKENPKVTPLPAEHKAKRGEVVTMDFEGKVAGVAFPGGKAENFTIEIGSGRLIDTFEDQLVGMKAGDEKEVRVTFPADYFSAELAGKEATFAVKVREVATLETPDPDDAFAKTRGFADLAGLRAAARDQIVRHYDSIVRARLKKRLFDRLDVLCSFPLPSAMMEAEFGAIWSQLQAAKQQAAPGEDVYEGKGEEAVREEYRKIAERRVRLGILLAEIGNRQKLQTTREEVTQAIIAQASRFPGQEQAVYDYYKKQPERLDELRGPILEEKAVDWLLSQVKLADKQVDVAVLRADAPLAELAGESRPRKAAGKPRVEGKEEKKVGKKKTRK